jgi:hypothetical protein
MLAFSGRPFCRLIRGTEAGDHPYHQAAMDADMKTPLVQGLLADLDELTVHGSDFRIERMFAIPS